MASPVVKTLIADAWTLVAEASTGASIHILDFSPKMYLQTYRVAGQAAPTDMADAIGLKDEKEVANEAPVDIYIVAQGADGRIRVDVGDLSAPTGFAPVLSRYLATLTGTATTLTADTVKNSNSIEVASVVGIPNGSALKIGELFAEPTFPIVVSQLGNVLTLDRRIDFDHLNGDAVVVVEEDMATTAGSLAAPLEYFIAPEPGEVYHVTRLLMSITHASAGDLGLFGNLPALTNGVIIRALIDGQYETLSNWKTNADAKDDMYDVEFDTRSGGGGTFGTSGRGTFTRLGTVVRLDGGRGDRIEFYVQDDLTGLTAMKVKAQGHRGE